MVYTMVNFYNVDSVAIFQIIISLTYLIQLNTLKSKTLKSNFAQVEAFSISRPKLLFVWLILQQVSKKNPDESNFS